MKSTTFEPLNPDAIKRVELAIEDIRSGRMVILIDDEDRENEGDLTMAADAVTPEAINFMATYGRGLICLTLTSDRVSHLQLPMMVSNNQSPYHTAFTVSIEAREGVTTGISAADRAHTIKTAINPNTGAHDLVTPGHIFPLRARDGGVLVRTGQTEGSVDLSRLAGLSPAGVICEIMNPDGTMARLPNLIEFGKKHNIRIVSVADIIRWRMNNEVLIHVVLESKTRIGDLGVFDLRLYESMSDKKLHLVLSKGQLDTGDPTLVRVQAASHVVDVFGFRTTDSWSQIEMALSNIEQTGAGAFLYMNVAGQSSADVLESLREHITDVTISNTENNADAVENPEVSASIAGQLRDLGNGAQILVDLGIQKLRLMTNNPRKIYGLEGFGLEIVERLPLQVPISADNRPFLSRRKSLLGHLVGDGE